VIDQHDRAVTLLKRWCDVTVEALGEAREEIDALNVYPVPDSDTGTNVYLTFEAARQAICDGDHPGLAGALGDFGRGALLGARGNSGVILSQMLRAGSAQLLRGDPRRPGRLVADALRGAAEGAYAAVGDPVEGTMLTVARAAADAAQSAAAALADDPAAQSAAAAPADLTAHSVGAALADDLAAQAAGAALPDDPAAQAAAVITAAADAARAALERTTEQLDALRDAGVVDAGGRAICVVIDSAQAVLTGRRPAPYAQRATSSSAPPAADRAPVSSPGPGYEVMFLLDADDGVVPDLRRRLAGLGDSLVVVGGDGLWNVHVHVDDVGASIEAAIEAGRPYRVRVTHLAEQVGRATADRRPPAGRGVVAIAAGEGLRQLFEDAGATVLSGRRHGRPSTAEVLGAIRSCGAREVVVLPNDSHSIVVAEGASDGARQEGVTATVIPTRAQVQGLAAMAVHDPLRRFSDDVVAMTSAAGHARHGAVTVAAGDAMTSVGPCRRGDILGVVDGDFAVIGDDITAVALEVVERLLSGGGEMVTLVRGEGCDTGLCDAVDAAVTSVRPAIEVVAYDGGQDRYALLIGVE
jgi:DAK2 domain fusion protein YloV